MPCPVDKDEDTVIDSIYSESITYPKLPIVSDNTFKGFYTSYEGGSEVTTLEGITSDSIFYARWETEMIPVTFDGETTEYPKGTEITLPSGKTKEVGHLYFIDTIIFRSGTGGYDTYHSLSPCANR